MEEMRCKAGPCVATKKYTKHTCAFLPRCVYAGRC